MKRKTLLEYKSICELIIKDKLNNNISEKDILVYILEKYIIGIRNIAKAFDISENVLWNRVNEYQLKYLLPSKEHIIEIQNQSRKKTMLCRYGVEHMSQIESVKDSKRGDKNPSTKNIVKEKKKRTTLKHYGVENPFQAEEIKSMISQTNLKFYGVNNPSKSNEIKEKKASTTLKNYGVTTPIKSSIVREQTKRTNLRKYNVEWSIQSTQSIKKRKATNLARYGAEYPLQSEIVKDKIEATNLARYGVEYPFHSSDNTLITRSSYEDEICYILNKNNIKYEISNRSILNPYEIDIFISDKNIAIEFNGVYWHDKDNWQKYILLETCTYQECKEHYKTLKCKEKGINLFHIWEDDWNNLKNKEKYILEIVGERNVN